MEEKKLNIYRVSQSENRGYDFYDLMVVIAPDEATARSMDPRNGSMVTRWREISSFWATTPENVIVELIGKATVEKPGIVISSFNAG